MLATILGSGIHGTPGLPTSSAALSQPTEKYKKCSEEYLATLDEKVEEVEETRPLVPFLSNLLDSFFGVETALNEKLIVAAKTEMKDCK